MNIAVYCGSTKTNEKVFYTLTKELGLYLGSCNHTLVYGGAKTGLMGEISNAFHQANSKVIGVIPNIELIINRKSEILDECIYVDSMASRRLKMIEISDLFIALPGGPGTLDELSEVLDLIRLKEIRNKKLIIYNMNHYYDSLEDMIGKYFSSGFLEKSELKDLYFAKNLEEIKKIINEK